MKRGVDYPVGSYGSLEAIAIVEIREAEQKDSGLALFAWLAALAFDKAVGIVQCRDGNDVDIFIGHQVRMDSGLSAWKSLPGKEFAWSKWPNIPTTFGQYQHAGDSALQVALSFADTVSSAVAFGRLKGMQKHIDQLRPMMSTDLVAWMKATRNELESHTLDLANWPRAAILRDASLIHRSIEAEFQTATKSVTPNDQRNDWLLREFLLGTGLKTIQNEMKKRSDWEPIVSDAGIRKAIRSHCEKFSIQQPEKRRKGRTKSKTK